MAIKNYTESWVDTYKRYLGSINFTSGDYDGLKNVIRDYVVRQNPEGYNNWSSSSEVGMFVNAIAYLGENINYRVDLNVNDLFPSTTTRKQSLLNFTRMLSYESKRNICANGLAKIVSISTTQDITDSSGTLLQGVTINWNDETNEDWLEQFLTIMNSAFTYTNQFGKPIKNVPLNNISNQLYQMNTAINVSSVYSFSKSINGSQLNFDVVNPDIDIKSSSVVEMEPMPERMFQMLYRNDGAGNSSKNTGFFVYWKQGSLNSELYNFDEKIENNKIKIDTKNINNDDVWFQELNKETGYVSSMWTKIPTNEFLSYTNTDNNIRTIYKVETDEEDKISLKFPDGYFGDIPFGLYRVWYRTSDGNLGLYIKPSDISNVSITIPYFNNSNSSEENVYYLTLTFSVADVSHIRQSVPSESIENIKENAPDVYSTQDRMVSAKDYNYFPKTIGQQLHVLKAVERTYAGNSRFIDLNDPTGAYDDVNVVATDGYMYLENDYIRSTASLTMAPDIIYDRFIDEKLSMKEISNLYYQYYDGEMIPNSSNENERYYWNPTFVDGINTMCGYFISKDGEKTSRVSYSDVDNNINVGDLLCFQEYIMDGNTETDIDNYVWARVESFDLIDTETIIKITEVLDVNKLWKIRKGSNGSKLWSKYNNFTTTIDKDIKDEIIKRMTDATTQTSFGITYVSDSNDDSETYGRWVIVDKNDDINGYLSDEEPHMVSYNNEYLNESYNVLNWFFRIKYTSNGWEIDVHRNRIIFGSVEETSFFFNTDNKMNSSFGYFFTDDVIKVTKETNRQYRDYYWKPYDVIKYTDGYVNPQEFCCEAYDKDKDSVMDVPSQYNDMVNDFRDIIFLKEDNGNEEEKTFLVYNDLYSIYDENGIDMHESYKCSLWEKTLISGYYYCYNKINAIIGANRLPEQDSDGNRKEIFSTPGRSNVLCSDGYFRTFVGSNITINEENLLPYDFVDYIKEYDDLHNPVYYNDKNIDGSDKHGYLYKYDAESKKLTYIEQSKYEIVKGLTGITFLWKHRASEDYIIDPCSTNIIDMYTLTNEYYTKVQNWVQGGKLGQFPKAPSAYELKGVFSSLEENKMISDTLVWHPVTYKLIFGQNADVDTHCIFKVIKQNDLISDNEVKKKVISLIDEYFKSFGVGETFYFTKLSTYIENNIPELINTILIVPTDTTNKFGKLFQIKCEENEILLSSATLDDVQIISTITEQNIRYN